MAKPRVHQLCSGKGTMPGKRLSRSLKINGPCSSGSQ